MSKFKIGFPGRQPTSRLLPLLVVAAIACLCGCAHTGRRENRALGGGAELLPRMSSIITGPAAMLLTNGPGFQSEVVVSFDDIPDSPAKFTGELLVHGSIILLASAPTKSAATPAAGFTWIWDAAAGRGYVLSEALQGYAPISGPAWFTNVVMAKTGATPPPMEGRSVEALELTATGGNGESQAFELLRDAGAGGLPLQIRSVNVAPGFTMTLTKIQPGTPPDTVFTLPNDFTRYHSQEALLVELTSRQQDVSGGGTRGGFGDGDRAGGERHDRGGEGGSE